MYLLMITLMEDLVGTLITYLAELGIEYSWISHTDTIKRHLVYDVPLFAGFRDSFDDTDSNYKTVHAVIEDISLVKKLNFMLSEADINFTEPSVGFLIVVPISIAIGENLGFWDEFN